jgi:hypothetical protein
MDRLSSCYFCGGALDVSLSEYPVVPKDLRADGDETKTVVLCGTCRKKLATVVEDVVAATGAEPGEDGRSFEGTGFEPDESAETDTAEPLFEEREDEGAVSTDEDASPATTAAGDEGDATASTDAEADEPEPQTTAPATEDSVSDSDGGDDHSEGQDGDDDGPTMTRLEYNKVMRLLKNREFPVDRMEIRDVATSAYQISPDEFDAVIEAAIERDLLAEEDGQFVDPS